MKLKRIDLVNGVQFPKLGVVRNVSSVGPSGQKVDIEFIEERGIARVTVDKEEPVFVFRENITSFRELKVEAAKK